MSRCEFCEKPLNPDHRSTCRKVTGWTQARRGGGTNHIALPESLGLYAHDYCIDIQISKAKAGAGSAQGRLL